MRTRLTMIAVGAAALLAPDARAQYDLPWSTIDGGAAEMTGGEYLLRGTAAQPDAGPPGPPMGAVEYRLSGGFWAPPLFDPSCNVADLASPYGVLDLADIGGFVQAFLAREPVADLDPPYGVFDLGDIATFVIEFEAGCPS